MHFYKVTIIEDEKEDAELLKRAFKKSTQSIELSFFSDGAVALKHFESFSNKNLSDLPDIIILDLNLPRHSGLEILQRLKTHPILKIIPVIIMSSSEAKNDILKSYEYGANCFVKKPLDLLEIERVIKALKDFWLTATVFPTEHIG